MELFKLLGTIAVDNSDANKALDETSNKGEKTQGKLSKTFGAIGKGAVAVGKTVVTGLAVGGAAFAGLTAKALSASGELEQNMGGSEAVFGKYATKMQDTAKTAFSNMGLSTSDFLATANKMGALFQGAGFSIAESSDLSASAMQRAADVASIMGIDTSAAMEAIAGAAKGNFTMMDNLGVAMNDTTLNAYAMEKGINKTTQEMTNQEKIGLAMEMFMEKTAYAAGNYAKENETLAGSLGTAKAALTNFLDGSGSVEDLVASFGNLAKVAVNSLQEILPRLTTGLTDIVKQIMPMLPPLLQTLLPSIVQGATALINGLVSAFPGIINALMGALPALIQGVQTIINALITALPSIIQSLVSALPTLIPLVINALVSMIVTLCTMLPQIIQPIIDYLPDIIIAIVDALLNNLPALLAGIVQLVVGIAKALPSLMGALWKAIKGIFASLGSNMATWFKPITDWFKNVWEGFTNIVSSVWDVICNVVSIAVKLIGSILKAAFDIITLPFRFIWENCKDTIMKVWNAIKSAVSTAINAVKSVITSVMNAIKNFLTPILNGIKNTFSTVWNAIKNAVTVPVNAVKKTVTSVFNSIKTTISNVINSIKSTVTSVFGKIRSAMETPIQKARDTIKGIVDRIKGFFSGLNINFPHIKLPHFSIKPSGWKIGDLLEGSIPSLGISWYAKAMKDPMIMTRPTIFGYDASTGQLMGGGEAGSEVVSGTGTLMNMIQTAVAAQNEAVVTVLYAILDAIINGNSEMIRALLADKTWKVGEREFARLVREYA